VRNNQQYQKVKRICFFGDSFTASVNKKISNLKLSLLDYVSACLFGGFFLSQVQSPVSQCRTR